MHHYFHDNPREIRGLRSRIAELKVEKSKTVLKNGQTHLFIETPVALASDWSVCAGCSLCTKPHDRPKLKYVVYPPLILLPTGSDGRDAKRLLQEHPNCTHVAINAPIKHGDVVRRPQIEPVVGDFGHFDPDSRDFDHAFWATSVQNGIFQTWAPLYTMFSRGNVTEKKRVLDTFASQQPISGSTVVDLYSGIGYFALPYARQRPRIVYCWEINPWSVEGMLRAARQNRIKCRAVTGAYAPDANDEVVIFVEDNANAVNRIQELDLAQVSHINMGLLPHARDAIPVALALSAPSRTPPVIHLHENVAVGDFERWQAEMEQALQRKCIHLEKIKQFSPKVFHVTGDFA